MTDSSVHLIFKVKQYQNAIFAKAVYYGKTRTQVKIIIVSRRVKCLYSKWDLLHKFIITARKQIWGKVMFLHLSVILFMGRGQGGCLPHFMQGYTPWHPRQTPTPKHYGIRSTSGQYASYWNAYLFIEMVVFLRTIRLHCTRFRR